MQVWRSWTPWLRIPGVSDVTAAPRWPTNYDLSARQLQPSRRCRTRKASGPDHRFQFLRVLSPESRRGSSAIARSRHGQVCVSTTQATAFRVGERVGDARARFCFTRRRDRRTAERHFMVRLSIRPPAITIAGVVPDFPSRFRAHAGLNRRCISWPRISEHLVSIRLTGKQMVETLAAIDDVWKKLGEPRAISRWLPRCSTTTVCTSTSSSSGACSAPLRRRRVPCRAWGC